MARRARSKQAMQKLITRNQQTWGDSDTFKTFMLSPAAGFDDECIVKRLRVTIQVNPNDQIVLDGYEPLYWTIVQLQTTDAPTESTMYENNTVIATGIATASNTSVYDHTITMRKLSGSSVYLCLSNPGTFGSSSVEHNVIGQLHYVES